MTRSIPRTLREDLGGRRLLDRRVLVWLIPTALVTSVLTRDPADARSTLGWIGVNLASLALVWLWVELLRVVVISDRHVAPAPIPLVVLIGASAGAVKGTTTSLFGWTAGLLPTLMPAAEWWRAASTSVQGAFLLPLVTIAVATLDRSRIEYDRLVAERAQAALLDAGRSEGRTVDADRLRLIAGFVEEARRRLSDTESRTVAPVLERLVEERLRPMTRELWRPSDIGTDFRARSLLRAAITANPFPIGIVAVAYGLSVFASRAQNLTLEANLLRTAASTLTIVVVFGLARRWRPSRPTPAVLHLVTTIVVLAGLQTFLVERIADEGVNWRASSIFFSVLAWIAPLTLLGGAGVVAARDSDAVRTELARIVASDAAAGAVGDVSRRLQNREVADQLHSGLQNRLISAAHRIAASGEHPSVVREELDAIELLLDGLATGVDTDGTRQIDARRQFADVTQRWDGFVRIAADLDPAIDALPPAVQDRVAQVLVEAVNNAVRHGRAASIDLTLATGRDPSTLHLTVDDDGIGPVRRPPGLGSALLDAMCDGDWGLERRPEGGSRLTASLRVATP